MFSTIFLFQNVLAASRVCPQNDECFYRTTSYSNIHDERDAHVTICLLFVPSPPHYPQYLARFPFFIIQPMIVVP